MAETIRGISVVIGAETTGLDKALSDVTKKSGDIASELRQVERLLKFNPKNTELLAQKQKLLGDQVATTRERLDRLKNAQGQINDQFKKGDITEGQYRAFQRELVATESKLNHFEKQLKSTQDRSKEFADRMGELSTKLEGLGKKFAPFSAAGAAVTGALTTMAVKAGIAADDLNTLSATTGLSTETLQKFQYVSDLIDVSMSTLSGSLSRLTRNMGNARDGNLQTQEAFSKLGVSITNVNGNLRDNEDVFNEAIKALGNIEDATERDATAMRLFGRSAQELNPLIMGGADDLKRLGEEAKAAGLIMSQEALDDINEFNDEIDILKATTKATGMQLGTTVGKVLLPALQSLSERLKDVLDWVRNLDERVLKITLVVAGVVAAIAPLLLVLGKIVATIKILTPLFAALVSPVGLVVAAVAALSVAGIALYKNWSKVSAGLSTLKIKMLEFAKSLLDSISKFAQAIPGLSGKIEKLKKSLNSAITSEQYKQVQRYRLATEKTAEAVGEQAKQTEGLTAATEEQTAAVKELTEAEKKLQKDRENIEAEWTKKLFEQTATRLELLDQEEKEALAKAEELGASKVDIEKYYENERNKIYEEERKKRQAIIDEETKKIEEAAKKQKEARESFENEWNQKYFQASASRDEILEAEYKAALSKAKELGATEADIVAYYEQKKRELRHQTFLGYLSTTQDIMGRIGDIFSQAFSNREQEIDNWYQNQKNALDASLLDEEAKEAKLKELDEERDKRKREAARKQAAVDKASSLFSIAINTARAVVEALPNIALSGIIGALGAAQALAVAAKPLPALKDGGKAVAPTMALIGEGRHEEAVLPLSQKVFEEMGKGIVANLPQMAAAGNGNTFHFHIGVMIGDERGYKQLARKVFSYEPEVKSRLE